MSEYGSILAYLRDPRLTAHATSALPAWLWSADATRVLWANPTAAAIFDAPSPAAMAGSTIDPRGTAALQIARLAGTLPHGAAPRLERLRGFGTRFRALMCACSRVSLADRTAGDPGGGGRAGRAEPAARRTRAPAVRRLRRADRGVRARRRADPRHADGRRAAARTEIARRARRREAGWRGAAGRPGRPRHGASHVGEVAVERIGADAATVLAVTFAARRREAEARTRRTPEAEPAPETADQDRDQDRAGARSARACCRAAAGDGDPPWRPRRRPSGASRCASSGRWMPKAASRVSSDEFIELIGPRTAAALGRPWSEIARALGLDRRRPGRARHRVARHLERHHRRLAGRWHRRAARRRTVGPAGVRSRPQLPRLSRLRRLPRRRAHHRADADAPLRASRRRRRAGSRARARAASRSRRCSARSARPVRGAEARERRAVPRLDAAGARPTRCRASRRSSAPRSANWRTA